MLVASTTLRRPAGAGAIAASCVSIGSEPCSGCSDTSAWQRRCSSASTRRISPAPGRNTSTEPGSVGHGLDYHPGDVIDEGTLLARALQSALLAGGAWRVVTGHARPSLLITGTSPSSFATAMPSSVADITRILRSSRSESIAAIVKASPVSAASDRSWNSSKITRPDAVERQVVLQHPGENPFGDHLDPGARADPGVEAHPVSDGLADPLAQRPRHARRGRARGKATRLQHHDPLACEPRLVEQRQRDTRGLAGTRRGLEHGGTMD